MTLDQQNELPFMFCPSYIRCSVNQCPLDPGWNRHHNLEGDESKCVAQRPTRQRIMADLTAAGNRHLPALRFEGRTANEERGRKRAEAFAALPEAEQQAFRERLERARAAKGTAKTTTDTGEL